MADALPSGMTPELLELLRVRVGLASDDTSKDSIIIAAWITGRDWVSAFLNRNLVPGEHEEIFTHVCGTALSLSAYPVTKINSITTASSYPITQYHLEKQTGLVHLDNFTVDHEVSISYEALPPEDGVIFIALLAAFDEAWKRMSATTAAGTGVVKSMSIDGMKTEYFDPNSSGSGGSGNSGLPASIESMLMPYRREFV